MGRGGGQEERKSKGYYKEFLVVLGGPCGARERPLLPSYFFFFLIRILFLTYFTLNKGSVY